MLNISQQDLGNIYKFLDKVVVSGNEVAEVYNLKMKLISIMKAMESAKPQVAEPVVTPVTLETPTLDVSKDALDMK